MRRILFALCLLLSMSSLSLAQEDTQTPYDIALARILEAQETEITSLNLSGLGLTELPPEIGNLTNLEWLSLSTNNLSSLPPEIGNLSDLQVLQLHGNDLSSLPSEIGNLTNLQGLYLQGNELSSLPSEIWNLTHLQGLGVGDNQLRSLPSEIGNLISLQRLYLPNNDLSSLPSEIGTLSNLCYLNIQDNQLRHLPSELGQLDNLTEEDCVNEYEITYGLLAGGNPLISPPEEVIAEGTPAILAYLRNQAWWHLQRLLIGIASAVGFLAIVILGLRYRQRRHQRKPKAKRSDIL